MWFARFQILICEPLSIWRKLLVLSLMKKPEKSIFLIFDTKFNKRRAWKKNSKLINVGATFIPDYRVHTMGSKQEVYKEKIL